MYSAETLQAPIHQSLSRQDVEALIRLRHAGVERGLGPILRMSVEIKLLCVNISSYGKAEVSTQPLLAGLSEQSNATDNNNALNNQPLAAPQYNLQFGWGILG